MEAPEEPASLAQPCRHFQDRSPPRPPASEGGSQSCGHSLQEIAMAPDVSLWPLVGVGFIIAGFILRFNPMIVVIGAAIVPPVPAACAVWAPLTPIGAASLKPRNLTPPIILPLAARGRRDPPGLRQH